MAKTSFQVLLCGDARIKAVDAHSVQTFSRHTHEQFGIGLVTRGAQKSFSCRGMVEAGAGDLITVNPNEVHDGAPLGDAGRSWKMLYLEPGLAAELLRDGCGDNAGAGVTAPGALEFHAPVLRDAALAAAFVRAYDSAISTLPGARLAAEQHLLDLLAKALLRHRYAKARSVAPTSAAQSMMLDDPLSDWSLAELAQACGMSRFQLVRAFARNTGFTPHAYLVHRRILLARQLIAGGTPLAEAAAASGFADQSHMTRVFVRKYGISPGAFAISFKT
ncbi:helix-turn-helix domain-containing protein [Pseudoduganella sp. DS3]|uniref:Helix-turn-helix domain-containing protein n=1 Tax=Pseudoduganella guangdongensis TaxID=2692179 RepID=A0A6N9HAX7_9BURK|nr:AraC family transcriptional regulator [Pseudoduganella guangdongensis]MYN00634.1 helix-turn-helix domain-containing protein [Pseudoduganella guangdongensis]